MSNVQASSQPWLPTAGDTTTQTQDGGGWYTGFTTAMENFAETKTPYIGLSNATGADASAYFENFATGLSDKAGALNAVNFSLENLTTHKGVLSTADRTQIIGDASLALHDTTTQLKGAQDAWTKSIEYDIDRFSSDASVLATEKGRQEVDEKQMELKLANAVNTVAWTQFPAPNPATFVGKMSELITAEGGAAILTNAEAAVAQNASDEAVIEALNKDLASHYGVDFANMATGMIEGSQQIARLNSNIEHLAQNKDPGGSGGPHPSVKQQAPGTPAEDQAFMNAVTEYRAESRDFSDTMKSTEMLAERADNTYVLLESLNALSQPQLSPQGRNTAINNLVDAGFDVHIGENGGINVSNFPDTSPNALVKIFSADNVGPGAGRANISSTENMTRGARFVDGEDNRRDFANGNSWDAGTLYVADGTASSFAPPPTDVDTSPPPTAEEIAAAEAIDPFA